MASKKLRGDINIGIIIFGAIFLYLMITLVLFISHRHVDTFQVVTGPLSGNDTCTALIMRDEEVVLSTTSGYVNHFVYNGSKSGARQPICAVTSTPLPNKYKTLKPAEYAGLRKLLSQASVFFDPSRFESVSDLKFDILGSLWSTDSLTDSSGNFYESKGDGYVAYSTDGKEKLTEEELTPEIFKTSLYSMPKISNQSVVETGEALYRIVYGETWSICFPITDKQLVRLAQKTDLQVRFLKDNTIESGTLTFFMNGEQRYARIRFDAGMYRFLDDRYVDIELFTNNETGLKIPVSSIVKKEFYAIPELFVSGAVRGEALVKKESRNADGSKQIEYIDVTLYAETTDPETETVEYYVEKNLFEEGDILLSPDTDDKFTIGKTGSLEGVYCVNKGYAVFRKISIIDQNEEYCIVEPNTSYGVAQFDFIVQNGSSIKESEIIY